MDNALKAALEAVSCQFTAYKVASAALDPIKKRKERLERLIERHQRAVANIEDQLTKARNRAASINPYSDGRYLEPLAQSILIQFPDMVYRIRGPYGLASASSIYVYDPSVGETKEGMVGWLEFRCDDNNEIGYVDYSKDDGQYPPKSIGAVNGLNHPVVPLNDSMTIEQLADLFRRNVR